MLWIVGYFQAFLVVSRFVLNFLNFLPASVCLYHSTPTENCSNGNQSHNILGRQEVSNAVNTVGVLLEDGNSLLLISAIFSWKQFKVGRYFRAVLRVGHFWVWCLFCITNSLSILYVDIVHGKDKTGNINVNAVALIIEMFLLTLLASAVNFIAHETYVKWVEDRFWDQLTVQRVFKPLFRVVLCAYFFRNLGLFLYDTALVSMSISLLKGGRVEGSRDWDSLLLLLSAAFRGSFTKFFFEKMFQGQDLPPEWHVPEMCRRRVRSINLVPIVFVPLDQQSENESSGSSHFRCVRKRQWRLYWGPSYKETSLVAIDG